MSQKKNSTKKEYITIPIEEITPANLYKAIIKTIISKTPIIPAVAVFSNDSEPNEAETIFDDNSLILTGRLPELIKSVKFSTSSSVKFPCIITSDANPCDTVAALKQFESTLPQRLLSFLKLSFSSL